MKKNIFTLMAVFLLFVTFSCNDDDPQYVPFTSDAWDELCITYVFLEPYPDFGHNFTFQDYWDNGFGVSVTIKCNYDEAELYVAYCRKNRIPETGADLDRGDDGWFRYLHIDTDKDDKTKAILSFTGVK